MPINQPHPNDYLAKPPLTLETEEFAAFYDELPLWSAPFASLMLRHVPIRSGIVIVDAGAGTGFLTVELAERCGFTSQVIAVDPWQTATSRLAAKVERYGLSNVQIISKTIDDADIENHSVDLIVSNLGLNNFENPAASLASCHQMAKEGADLILTTNTVGHMKEFYDVFRTSIEARNLHHLLPEFDEHVDHRGSVQSLQSLLTKAGFEEVEIIEEVIHMRFANGSAFLRHHLIGMGFLPQWNQLVPDEHLTDVFTTVEDKLNLIAEKNGGFSVTIPVVLAHFRKCRA